MLLPYFPRSAQLIFVSSIILGLGFPALSARAVQLSNLSQLFSPSDLIQESFDPPGAPVPRGTQGAGSRGFIQQPTFPQM